MSYRICTRLEILNRDQACEIKILAAELTRKQSLEDLGFDLTSPENEDGYTSFKAIDSMLCWCQHTSSPSWLKVDNIINCLVHRFPNAEFISRDYWDGPLVQTEYIKGDYREELVRRIIDIGVEDSKAFAKLASVFKEEQRYPFFIFPLPELPISKVEPEIERILAHVAKVVPDIKLYCILVKNNDGQGTDSYIQKGIYENGKKEWHEISDENYALFKTSDDIDVWAFNKPNEEVYKIFFEDSYREKLLAQIAKEEAEEKAKASRLEIGQNSDELPF